MRIAIDAMGGDHAPRNVIEGVLASLLKSDVDVLLVGPDAEITAELRRRGGMPARLRIVDAPDVVGMGDPASSGVRRRGASIRVAAELVARGEADALFSAGNTGAAIVAAHSTIGMLPRVDRPALATAIPTRRGMAVMLDSGANLECRAQHLLQFGLMGSAYARVALGLATPRVALLSIAEEETKGTDLTREAYALLKHSSLDFIGNLEAREVYTGVADVIVCDGHTGNVTLKVSESLAEMFEQLLRRELGRGLRSRVGAALVRPALARLKRRVDYAEEGGAPLLGIAGVVIVGHGRSSAKAVRNAVLMASRLARQRLVPAIEQELAGA